MILVYLFLYWYYNLNFTVYDPIGLMIMGMIFITFGVIHDICSTFIPFCLGRNIYFGDEYVESKGWIITFGLNGTKYWNGHLKGKVDDYSDIGVKGFTGLKIGSILPNQYFLGFASHVCIEDL